MRNRFNFVVTNERIICLDVFELSWSLIRPVQYHLFDDDLRLNEEVLYVGNYSVGRNHYTFYCSCMDMEFKVHSLIEADLVEDIYEDKIVFEDYTVR